MLVTVFKVFYKKQKSKNIHYGSYKNFSNDVLIMLIALFLVLCLEFLKVQFGPFTF